MEIETSAWEDPAVQALSPLELGIWVSMLFMFNNSESRGKLTRDGKALPDEVVAAGLGYDMSVFGPVLEKMLRFGIFGREESSGALVWWPMVRKENVRLARAKGGALGGRKDAGLRDGLGRFSGGEPSLLNLAPSATNLHPNHAPNLPSNHVSNQQTNLQLKTENGEVEETLSRGDMGSSVVLSSSGSEEYGDSNSQDRGLRGFEGEEGGSGGSLVANLDSSLATNLQLEPGPTWIDPLFEPSSEQWGRLYVIALEYWPELSEENMERKLRKILTEFIDYWLEFKRMDLQHRTKKGKKTNWYMAFRNRVIQVGTTEVARRTSQNYYTKGVNNGIMGRQEGKPGGGSVFGGAAERRAANLAGQDDYLRSLELQAQGGDASQEDAPALKLDDSDFG